MGLIEANPQAWNLEGDISLVRATAEQVASQVYSVCQPDADAAAAKVNEQTVEVEVESGVKIKVLVIKPKSLSGSSNPCMFYGLSNMGVTGLYPFMKTALQSMAVEMNLVLAIPDYRKAPENKQPAGMRDMQISFDYFHKNASQFGFDQNRMVLAGQSGGALVALGAAIFMSEEGTS